MKPQVQLYVKKMALWLQRFFLIKEKDNSSKLQHNMQLIAKICIKYDKENWKEYPWEALTHSLFFVWKLKDFD